MCLPLSFPACVDSYSLLWFIGSISLCGWTIGFFGHSRLLIGVPQSRTKSPWLRFTDALMQCWQLREFVLYSAVGKQKPMDDQRWERLLFLCFDTVSHLASLLQKVSNITGGSVQSYRMAQCLTEETITVLLVKVNIFLWILLSSLRNTAFGDFRLCSYILLNGSSCSLLTKLGGGNTQRSLLNQWLLSFSASDPQNKIWWDSWFQVYCWSMHT